MSGADDLREAILDALWVTKGAWADTDAVMAVLSDPVRRLAILNAMGLDVVREGFARIESDGWQGDDGDEEAESYIDVERWHAIGDVPVLVVRPRGEETDA